MGILGRPRRRRRNVESDTLEPQDFCGFYGAGCHRPVGYMGDVTLGALLLPRAGDFLEISMTAARRENEPKGTASVIPPIPDWARVPAVPPNPDPKRLRWDAD